MRSKKHNEIIHLIDWDCIILDEYHFGAWRDSARELYDPTDEDVAAVEEPDDIVTEDDIGLTGRHYLYLSGTPFRAPSRMGNSPKIRSSTGPTRTSNGRRRTGSKTRVLTPTSTSQGWRSIATTSAPTLRRGQRTGSSTASALMNTSRQG